MYRSLVAAILIAVCLLVAGTSMATADVTLTWDSNAGPDGGLQKALTRITIPPDSTEYWGEGDVWSYGGWPGTAFSLSADYPQTLTATGGGSGPWFDGYTPIFVRVMETVQNVGDESWYDFHIRVDNPYKLFGTYTGWDVFQDDDLDPHGWDFYATDPAYYVDPGESFVCEFWFVVVPDGQGNGSFTITEWPTADVIPEPSGLVALFSGVSGLAALMLRRRHV